MPGCLGCSTEGHCVGAQSLARAKRLLPHSLKAKAIEAAELEASLRTAHDRLYSYREQARRCSLVVAHWPLLRVAFICGSHHSPPTAHPVNTWLENIHEDSLCP